jgi:hypothetical protein
MTMAERNVTVRDFLIFQLKLWLDGIHDAVVIVLSIGAIILDILSGKGRRPRLFYSVLRLSEKFDHWINLHGVLEQMDENAEDGLFGASKAGSDTLLGRLEQVVRGGDVPRSRRARGVRPGEDDGA